MTEANNTDSHDTGSQQPQAPQPQSQPPVQPQQQPANPYGQPQQPAAGQQQGQQTGWPQPPQQNDQGQWPNQAPNQNQPQNQGQWSGQGPFQYEPNRTPGARPSGFSTGMKIVWIALGFFLDIFAFPLPFILYYGGDRRLRNTALRYCLIGFILSIVASGLYLMYGDPSVLQNYMSMVGGTGTSTSTGSTGSAF